MKGRRNLCWEDIENSVLVITDSETAENAPDGIDGKVVSYVGFLKGARILADGAHKDAEVKAFVASL